MSKNKYNEFINGIDPSEELINETVNKMKEERKRMDNKNKRRTLGIFPKVAAAAIITAAALFLYSTYGNSTKGPLLYSELDFNDPVVLEGVVSEPYAGKIAPFSEEFLLEGDTFIKGTVVSTVLKEGMILYEIRVDKKLKAGEDIAAGDTLLVEMDTYTYTSLEGSVTGLKGNRQYILPLAKKDNGTYSIIYPFAPQIEVTNDGSYVLHENYTSLINEDAREITVDQSEISSYFSGKLYLLDNKDFEDQYISLIEK